jgi:hypothetical protein
MTTKDPEQAVMEEKVKAFRELPINDLLSHEVSKSLALLTLYQYLRDDTTIFQMQACADILDYIVPAWREIVPPEILGPIVWRSSKEVRAWRERVLERDQSKCTECGSEVDVKVYRIMSWSEHPGLRLVMENGKTVCNKCLALARKEYRSTKRSDTHE